MNDTKKFNLPPLPFGENDLSPVISSDTIQLHYGKHHQAYFNMLNTLAEGTKYNDMNLEDVVVESFKDKEQKIFNNAGQAWNHICLLYTSPSPRDLSTSRMPSSA